jgi:hypothetical protein
VRRRLLLLLLHTVLLLLLLLCFSLAFLRLDASCIWASVAAPHPAPSYLAPL